MEERCRATAGFVFIWVGVDACNARRSTRPAWSAPRREATSSVTVVTSAAPRNAWFVTVFPKLGVVCDRDDHFILACRADHTRASAATCN